MRTKQWIAGLNNKQRIRAIVNGVGFFSTVQDALSGPFSSQTTAMYQVLHEFTVSKEKITGIGRRVRVYDHKMQSIDFDIQVDLI